MEGDKQEVAPLFRSLLPERLETFPPPFRRSRLFLSRRPVGDAESIDTIGAGLRNLGNTCFLNAVLQCLTHTPPFVNSLRNCSHTTPCGNEGFCALCTLREHVNLSLSSPGRVIEPSYLVDNLSCISPFFCEGQQEDAHEYLHCLLQILDNCALGSTASFPCLYFQQESFIKKIFGGHLRSQIKCVNCSHCSEKFEPMNDLNLEIGEVDCLESALKSFTEVEFIGYDCENCKQGVAVMKQLMVDEAPNVLIIQLKRFSNDGRYAEKICKRVEYPLVLDLKPFVSNARMSQGELKYELYAVLVHRGFSLTSGHYCCFVRSSPKSWYELDDSEVHWISEETVLDQQAYILFYFQQGIPWSLTVLEAEVKNNFHKVISSPSSVLEEVAPSDESNSEGGGSSGNSSDADIAEILDNRNSVPNQERVPKVVDRRVSTILGKRNSEVPAVESLLVQDPLNLSELDFSHRMNDQAFSVPSFIFSESPVAPILSGNSSDAHIVDISDNVNLIPNQEWGPRVFTRVLVERISEVPAIEFLLVQDPLRLVEPDFSPIENYPAFPVPSSISSENPVSPKEVSQPFRTDKDTVIDSKPIRISGLDLAGANEFRKFEEHAPQSFRKVLKNMPGAHRACLLACASPCDVGTSKSADGAKKRVSPSDDTLNRGQKQKHTISNSGSVWGNFAASQGGREVLSVSSTMKEGRTISNEGPCHSSLKKDSALDDDDPYSLDFEIEQSLKDVIKGSAVSNKTRANSGFLVLP